MMRSVMLSDITSSLKDSDQFKNRKRRNEDAREYIYGQQCNTEALTRTHCRLHELQTINDEEITHCKDILSTQNHCKKQRHSNAAEKHDSTNKTK